MKSKRRKTLWLSGIETANALIDFYDNLLKCPRLCKIKKQPAIGWRWAGRYSRRKKYSVGDCVWIRHSKKKSSLWCALKKSPPKPPQVKRGQLSTKFWYCVMIDEKAV